MQTMPPIRMHHLIEGRRSLEAMRIDLIFLLPLTHGRMRQTTTQLFRPELHFFVLVQMGGLATLSSPTHTQTWIGQLFLFVSSFFFSSF
jgi:hypothetical protein